MTNGTQSALFHIVGAPSYCFAVPKLGRYALDTLLPYLLAPPIASDRAMIPQPPKFKQPKEIVRSNLHAQLSYFAVSWREGHLQARKDFLVRWRDCGRWLLVTIWLVTLIFSLIILILIDTGLRSDIRGDLGACLPDGSFSVEPDTYRYFSGSGFFEITLAFGSMSFTQVKVLDVAWDIVSHPGLLATTLLSKDSLFSWKLISHQGGWTWRSIPSRVHLVARFCKLCNNIHGGHACHVQNLPHDIFAKGPPSR